MNLCAIPVVVAFAILSILGLRRFSNDQRSELFNALATYSPCTIEVVRNDILVRVGPGANRGVLAYLPANQPFVVIGQATADDGSSWWRIDLPGAEQAWVAEADVTELGFCALVLDAAAPPIILPAATLPPSGESVSFPVYNCVYLGNGVFEWYSADVTYQDGAIASEVITGGPFQGQWQDTCPAEGAPGGDTGSLIPTVVPQPTGGPTTTTTTGDGGE